MGAGFQALAQAGIENKQREAEAQRDRASKDQLARQKLLIDSLPEITPEMSPEERQTAIQERQQILGNALPAPQAKPSPVAAIKNGVERILGKQPAPQAAPQTPAWVSEVAQGYQTPEQRAATLERSKALDAYKLQELKNQATGQKASMSRPVPYYAGAVSLGTAASMSQQGVTFSGADGQSYDLSKLPEGSVLIPVYEGGGKSYWTVATDKGRYETGDNQRKLEPAVGLPNPNAPSVGQARVPTSRSSTTVDPFGVVSNTSATTTPMGAPGASAAIPVRPPAPRRTQSSASNAVTPPLDASGHIPQGAANAGLVTAANQLLDGQDITKLALPARDKEAAASLASKYGWGQGLFTPQQKLLLRESSTFIDDAAKNPALAVLDNPLSRARLAALIGDATKKGMLGKLGAVAASAGASPEEMEFLRMYNQLVGTISGLGQLTRGGKVTESAINRLMQELPNPLTTSSAGDAKKRLARLQKEIDVAEDHGNFGVSGAAPKKSANAPKTAADYLQSIGVQ